MNILPFSFLFSSFPSSFSLILLFKGIFKIFFHHNISSLFIYFSMVILQNSFFYLYLLIKILFFFIFIILCLTILTEKFERNFYLIFISTLLEHPYIILNLLVNIYGLFYKSFLILFLIIIFLMSNKLRMFAIYN